MPDLTIARLNGNSNEFSDVLKGLEGLDHAIAFVYHRGNFKDWETSDMVKRVELNALVVCEYSEESGSWTVYQGQDVQAGTNLEDRRRISNDFPEVDIGAYTQPNDMFGSLKGDAVPAVVAFPSGPRQTRSASWKDMLTTMDSRMLQTANLTVRASSMFGNLDKVYS